jgi:hypothetical protein
MLDGKMFDIGHVVSQILNVQILTLNEYFI